MDKKKTFEEKCKTRGSLTTITLKELGIVDEKLVVLKLKVILGKILKVKSLKFL